MAIVMGFDIHREQVTFDALDDVTGDVLRGRIAPADRLGLRRFLASLPAGQVDVALEATTGWRFIHHLVAGPDPVAHQDKVGRPRAAQTDTDTGAQPTGPPLLGLMPKDR